MSLKNCQAGIVTALTTEARFLVLWKRLAASDSVGFPSSSKTTRWMMLSVRDRFGRLAGCEALPWELGVVVHLRSKCGGSGSGSSSVSGAVFSCFSLSDLVVFFGVIGVSVVIGEETTLGRSPAVFSSILSLNTSTLALKYSSRQSSSLTPFPSVSDGTPRFNSLSYTTLWSASSFLP